MAAEFMPLRGLIPKETASSSVRKKKKKKTTKAKKGNVKTPPLGSSAQGGSTLAGEREGGRGARDAREAGD